MKWYYAERPDVEVTGTVWRSGPICVCDIRYLPLNRRGCRLMRRRGVTQKEIEEMKAAQHWVIDPCHRAGSCPSPQMSEQYSERKV